MKNYFEKTEGYCFLCGIWRKGIRINQHSKNDEDCVFDIYGGKIFFEDYGIYICKVCLKKMLKRCEKKEVKK